MFDYQPEYADFLLDKVEDIPIDTARERTKQSILHSIYRDIAEEYNYHCTEKEAQNKLNDLKKSYPLIETDISRILYAIPKYCNRYVLDVICDICRAVEDTGYECGVDDGYDNCGKEMREEIESEVKQEYKEKFDCSGKEASHKIEQLRNERDKANKHAENVGESLLRKTDELIRTKEKLKENEDFIQFMKDEIPDVYKKLSKEYRNRKEMEEN